MTNEELTAHVNDWTGTQLNWNEDDVVWAASHDGGELIAYFEKLLRKMKRERAECIHDRERDDWVSVTSTANK